MHDCAGRSRCIRIVFALPCKSQEHDILLLLIVCLLVGLSLSHGSAAWIKSRVVKKVRSRCGVLLILPGAYLAQEQVRGHVVLAQAQHIIHRPGRGLRCQVRDQRL